VAYRYGGPVTSIPRKVISRATVAQGLRFLTVGIASFAVDLAMLRLLVWWGAPIALAAALAWACGFALNFGLNRVWSFRDDSPWHRAGARFLVLAAFNAVVTTIAVPALVSAGMDLTLAKTTVVVVLFGVNFIASRLWVFKVGADHAESSPAPSEA
jgi:putative flippase GtrA